MMGILYKNKFVLSFFLTAIKKSPLPPVGEGEWALANQWSDLSHGQLVPVSKLLQL